MNRNSFMSSASYPVEYQSIYVEVGYALDKDGNKRPLTDAENKVFARHLEASMRQTREMGGK